jgi:hypothetical protein
MNPTMIRESSYTMRHNEQDIDRLYTDVPDDAADETELLDQLPDDLDPHDMADSLPDEIVAEQGQDAGLDPDLAVFVARDELDDDDDEL